MLTPGEVVFRKAHDSQLIGIRAAARAGSRSPRPSASPRTSRGNPSTRPSPSDRTPTPQPPPATWPARAPWADRPYRPDSRARSTASTRSRACSLGRRLVSQEEPSAASRGRSAKGTGLSRRRLVSGTTLRPPATKQRRRSAPPQSPGWSGAGNVSFGAGGRWSRFTSPQRDGAQVVQERRSAVTGRGPQSSAWSQRCQGEALAA